MNRDDRERFADLFDRLVDLESEIDGDDERSALRVLSNAFLNYIDVSSDDGEAVVGALPWIAALHRWSQRDWDGANVAEYLLASPAVSALGPGLLASRLATPVDGGGSLPRAPHASLVRDDYRTVIEQLAQMDRDLRELAELDAGPRLTRVLSDSQLAASTAEICALDPDTELAVKLSRDSDGVLHATGFPWNRRFAPEEPLWVLAGLEDPEGRHPMADTGFEFARRSRGFERGLATNMVEHKLAPAIRAALLFGRGAGTDPHQLSDVLRQSDLFRDDPALEALAVALATVRGRFQDYMRGLLPLASLQPWVEYLRDGCVELAESRDITLREATGYAHYALHLVHICDLCAEGPDACTEATRDALMHVEDELKEFALAGNQGDSPHHAASLAAYEATRWRRKGATAELASRLTRLRGAWRAGLRPGPIGSPPVLDEETTAHSRALIESHFDDELLLAALARGLRHARIRGFDWSHRLAPGQLLTCMILALVQARDLPGVDITRPFSIDFSPVMTWLDEEASDANFDILSRMLAHLSVEQVVEQSREPTLLRVGLVGRVSDGEADVPSVDFEFVATRQMSAILELLSTADDDDPLAETLRARLDTMIEAGVAPASALQDAEESESEDDMVETIIPTREATL
ncbi:MAG: hypothetical protein ACQEVA_11195 [Myxococcota bacterium]